MPKLIKTISILLIVLAIFVIMSALPLKPALDAMQGWISSLGIWGPVLFGLIYVVATVLLLPGSVLTLGAGAIFGLVQGTIIVSISATTGAALALLVGRYLARKRVEKMATSYPKFHAVDRAVSEGGWKVVAMLRLSPVVPFNLQNYLYGLTGINFWVCVLTSWIAMLPGTFLYVYLGYAGRQGAEAAAGGAGGADIGKWVLLGIGLLATIGVTVYVTKLAKQKLAEHTEIESETETTTDEKEEPMDNASKSGWAGVLPIALVAVVMVALAITTRANAGWLSNAIGGLFGPAAVELKETYAENPDGATFDHSDFDRLLKSYVDEDGFVDYEGLLTERDALQAYIARLGEADFDALTRDEKLALLINAYNAFTLELILENWDNGQLESIKDIPGAKRWKHERWNLAGQTVSLDDIEHKMIRPNFKETRIHWAVVCAAYSCPPLRTEAYVGSRIDEQLAEQAEYVHSHPRWYVYKPETGMIQLTKLYDWYGSDFEQVHGGVLETVALYRPHENLEKLIQGGQAPSIGWIHYDWKLNSKGNKP